MELQQLKKAKEIKDYLESFDFIQSSEIIGSLKSENCDEYSDIDLRINVSGTDNGKILLMLPYLLSKKFPIVYTAFAPRFAPDLYVVSFGLKGSDIFHFVDIECVAEPHVNSLSKQNIKDITNMKHLKLKLYIGLFKNILRQKDMSKELSFLSKQEVNSHNYREILKEEFIKLRVNQNKDIINIIDKALDIIKTI